MKAKILVNNLLNELEKERIKYETLYSKTWNKGNFDEARTYMHIASGLSLAQRIVNAEAFEPRFDDI